MTPAELPNVLLVRIERTDAADYAYSELRPASVADATHVELELCTYSDYSGGAVERSNHRSILRDYPDSVTDVYGWHGTRSLVIALTCDDAALIGDYASLADYPLYDEGDHSELEMELADEAWDAYLYADVPSSLASDHGISRYMYDAYAETVDVRSEFYAITSEMPCYPYAETAVNIVFPDMAETLAQLAERIRAAVGPDVCEYLPAMYDDYAAGCELCGESVEIHTAYLAELLASFGPCPGQLTLCG